MLNGKDVTAQVRAAGLPLNIVIGGGYDKLQKLPKPVHDSLIKAGADRRRRRRRSGPREVEDADQVLVEDALPGRQDGHRRSRLHAGDRPDLLRPRCLHRQGAERLYARFCIDVSTRSAIVTRLAALKKKPGGEAMLNQYTTDFVIKTANNWKGPIGKFHLTIDKLKPTILSLCSGADLKKTGPTTFEATRMGFAPKQDIQILVLENPAP